MEEFMTSQYVPPADVTSDDKLWSALAYVFSPIVPVIILLMEEKKNRPFIKQHNMQALILGIVLWVINVVLSFVFIGICTSGLTLILMIYFGYTAYQGKAVKIPLVTDFVKNQGWE
jgi:uncharacterized membrane protein